MKLFLKDHFIPHEGNDHQPYFLRLRAALGILLLVILLEGTYLLATNFILPRSAQFAAIFTAVLIDQTNQVRESDKLATLRVNPKLELAARLKAEDMAAKGYFAHNTPDGKTPWYWFEQAGYEYAAAGENLAVNFSDSKDVTEAWMRSPSHRANIMNGNYTEIGIATAEGTYKGRPAIFVVQEFGRPSLIARQIDEASSTVAALTTLITNAPTPAPKTAPKITPPVAPPTPPVAIAPPVATTIPTPTTTRVAGVETAKLDVPVDLASSPPAYEAPRVSRTVTLLASPRTITNSVYLILGAILLLALGLAVFIKIRVQYPRILANGVLLVAIICALILLNMVLVGTKGAI